MLEELEEIDNIKDAKSLQYIIATDLAKKVDEFSNSIRKKKNQFKLEEWEEYIESEVFKLLAKFFEK